MIKMILVILSMVTVQQTVQAKTMNCQFTEPFISVQLPIGKDLLSDNPTAVVNDAARDGVITVKVKAGIESKTKLIYLLEMPGSESLQQVTVDLTKEGNDGMSDETYPAEGKIILGDFELLGGCELTE